MAGVSIVVDPTDTTTSINDLDITKFDETKLGIQIITYTLEDAFGKTVTVTRTYNVIDNEKPVITGSDEYLQVNSELKFANSTATDNFDNNVQIQIKSGNVDMSKPGTYPVVLIATDSSNNTSEEVAINVVVVLNTNYGYDEIVLLEGTLVDDIYEMNSSKKKFLKNNLTVTATKNNGETETLKSKQYEITGFNKEINDDNKSIKDASFDIKLSSNKEIRTSVDYTIVRMYVVKFVMPKTVDGLTLPDEYKGITISKESLRYNSVIEMVEMPYDTITINDKNYIKFTGWSDEGNIVDGKKTFTAQYEVYVRNYHAKVYTNLDGIETEIANCAMKYDDNIVSKCDTLSETVKNYDGFKFTGYTVDGVVVNDISSLVLTKDVKIVLNYERIGVETHINPLITKSYVRDYEFEWFTPDINMSADDGKNLFIIDFTKIGHTRLTGATVYYTDGTSETLNIELYPHLANPFYYTSINAGLTVERVEITYVESVWSEIKNFFEDQTKVNKYTYDILEDEFYKYN